uniref:Uncharacterized protein n=1 Tax=Triticum urartu TaxID=4572 RepID=A0A8R7UIM6_TRIUA
MDSHCMLLANIVAFQLQSKNREGREGTTKMQALCYHSNHIWLTILLTQCSDYCNFCT